MLRIGVLALMLAYAVVPPGFCLCGLLELHAPMHDFDPDDFDGENTCECPRIQQDIILVDAPDSAGQLDYFTLALVPDDPVHLQLGHTFDDFSPSARVAVEPLYLTLRALRI